MYFEFSNFCHKVAIFSAMNQNFEKVFDYVILEFYALKMLLKSFCSNRKKKFPCKRYRVLRISEFLDPDPIRKTNCRSVSISYPVSKTMSDIRSWVGIRKYPFYPVIFSRNNIGSHFYYLKEKTISFWTSGTKKCEK